jgi:hypothetical protein
MRQQTDTGERFSRGDALPIQIVALHRPFIGVILMGGKGSIAVADDLSKVPEIRAKGASSKFLNCATLS